jgi:hypothetical protein
VGSAEQLLTSDQEYNAVESVDLSFSISLLAVTCALCRLLCRCAFFSMLLLGHRDSYS